MTDGLFPDFSEQDKGFMREVLNLAEKGRGQVSPNPMVGAVIVKGDEIIARSYHSRYGGPHAEAIAIADARGKTEGATLYVNLEPCVHFGRTPPCTEKIAKAKIKRVVISVKDPDKLVNGKGIEALRHSRIQVDVGLLEGEARELNRAYFKHRDTGLPFVILKLATTLDAKIATSQGDSQWITGEEARVLSHKLRADSDAVMVGVSTVLADDPQLTVRLVPGHNPLKVILDSRLRTPADANLLKAGKTLIFTNRSSLEQRDRYEQSVVSLTAVEKDVQGGLDLLQVLKELGRRQITQLLVEGGGKVASSLLARGLVDWLVCCINPSLLGQGIGYTDSIIFKDIDQRLCLRDVKMNWIGQDIKLEARPCLPSAHSSRESTPSEDSLK
ncbi:bifunctional diaminohydroxyphosphoribosylaminopyrimidine deaminase/5-amino-6-(5-phosphoribosylamino)uracil reductase RibD [candidate division WOR-3 bacterium]|uniref:Riboflavin biosynthesis protein RibD n=1 Tax=candidate division WOR-3 bacterium TaxID=2052148 RepID=A0A9D5KBH2_UNCW3|nr:bifunctional diaminohydroxyphosphoribosylaminopyrimidine deaminase/5-amino-6-(5-phosphoribosylamino)uracil reductase RibD [candidate division WOR-3 bacterium]MBD3365104.1 bifunctional diaminohydroxyphosphoribosylaminopyrimidine deaminase/5-amino-6-(5-phosphoribosylamino)uracil reductase RibD [candidate division WOR-3 bacterium]